jgi:NAD dependent epimerase/dehydratase family enzyme
LASPNPATNGEISRGIAQVLGRPNLFPVPSFGLKMLFGEGAEPIITGQRVTPQLLQNQGFRFEHPDLTSTLRDHLA